MDAIAAYELTKYYGEKAALQGVSLQVPEGGAMACVGYDQAGKTTLVRLLAGLRRPSAGECSVLGLSPTHESARLHGMTGTVLHTARLYQSLSLWDNLRFFAGAHSVPKDQAIERISFLLRRLNIWEEREKRPEELPTGVLKRAGLARALVHRPRVLLMDEQGAGMDRETAERVREVLDYAVGEEGVSLLLCTRHMSFAQRICGSFGLLHQGVLIARGGMEDLRTGAGVRLKAALRLAEGQPGPAGFVRDAEGFWQRELQSEEEMPQLIAQVVEQGARLYEARVVRPELEEIYAACLAGGRRRERIFLEETGEGEKAGPYQEGGQETSASPEGD